MSLSIPPVNLSDRANREVDFFATNALARARAGFGHGGATGSTGNNASRGQGIISGAFPPSMSEAVPPADPSLSTLSLFLYLRGRLK
jgi:hypothetical protein